jgi:hypothetical protein
MTKSRFFLVCLVGMFTFLACSQPASAQSKSRFHVKAVPATHSDANREVTSDGPPANLYALEAAFTTTSYGTYNSDGSELWPCFGGTTDCPVIGDPQVAFPDTGAALGGPAYVWSLPDCDGTTNGSSMGGSPTYVPCGQTETWYEDDSNDATDDLLYRVEVVQGTNVIYDSGTIDFGPNPFGGLTPPADVIFSGDTNFGTLGETGKNNGNCVADEGYPTSADPGAAPFVIQANKTCVDPAAGVATVTATTEIATPTYTKKTTATACAPTAPPCYTVTYTKKYEISQKWNIYLQGAAESSANSR